MHHGVHDLPRRLRHADADRPGLHGPAGADLQRVHVGKRDEPVHGVSAVRHHRPLLFAGADSAEAAGGEEELHDELNAAAGGDQAARLEALLGFLPDLRGRLPGFPAADRRGLPVVCGTQLRRLFHRHQLQQLYGDRQPAVLEHHQHLSVLGRRHRLYRHHRHPGVLCHCPQEGQGLRNH